MIETGVGLRAAFGGDTTKVAYAAVPGPRAIHLALVRRGVIAQATGRPAAAQRLRDLARLRRARQRGRR
ncbi:hypothetical protein [Rubrobacter marinus]|uniref:hypothetical protein n=1 Tax=Rubrobacter marinus TaxID=2653852 RepID=UPI001A9D2FCA|nr:hypothetical protein [Rubrobacter marinus]